MCGHWCTPSATSYPAPTRHRSSRRTQSRSSCGRPHRCGIGDVTGLTAPTVSMHHDLVRHLSSTLSSITDWAAAIAAITNGGTVHGDLLVCQRADQMPGEQCVVGDPADPLAVGCGRPFELRRLMKRALPPPDASRHRSVHAEAARRVGGRIAERDGTRRRRESAATTRGFPTTDPRVSTVVAAQRRPPRRGLHAR